MVTPLEGVKVVDLSRMAPGPFCSMILGDLGADVLRVEEPGGGKSGMIGRTRPQPGNDNPRRAAAFSAINRNKRSIGLNLKHAEAQRILRKLSEEADVFLEGYRPGVVKRLGCDYETIREINPRIVYCSLSGYGQDGPYKNMVGHDINYISFAGALGLIGTENGIPSIPYNIIADMAGGGMHAAVGIMAALMAREKTGEGQYVDVSMMDGVAYLIASVISGYFANGTVPKPGKTMLTGGVPYYNVYECRDGKYISLGTIEPWFWEALCKALGRKDLIPYQHNTEKHPEIFAFLRETFKTKPRDEWWNYLANAGDTAVGKVLTIDELVHDPQVLHRGLVMEVGEVDGEIVRHPGVSPKLSATPGSVRRLGPLSGEHTDEVLHTLGYTEVEVQDLRKQGAIA